MHLNALKSIKNHIDIALEACLVQDGWPIFDSYADKVFDLSQEVTKHKNEWLTVSSCYAIFSRHLKSYLERKFPVKEGVSGKLTVLINGPEIIELNSSILNFIISIPRSYEIYFPLPSFKDQEINNIQLWNSVSMRKFNEGDTIPGGIILNALLGKKGFVQGTTYVAIKRSGYVGSSIDDIAFMEALSSFKQLLHMCLIMNLIALREPAISWADVAMSIGGGPLEAITVDLADQNEISSSIILPLSIQSYIQKIILNTSLEYFKNKLKETNLIERNDNDAQFIKSALEWAFDSRIEENETISFVQVSIGLEAILGEETGREPLTETLADRCAYLLGNTIENRKKIRRKFRDFYKLRSKLVHGRSMRLRDNEREFLWWGEKVLNGVILKEIKKL